MAIGKDLFLLMNTIGYSFNDIQYLENALTHSSFANERRAKGISFSSNERLEFLGDAVLQIVISEHLYTNYKKYSEGMLTKIRQNLVCEKSLAAIAREISLGDYIHLGKGEENSGCRDRSKVLADTFEALVGALYLDSKAFTAHGAKEAVLNLFIKEIEVNESLFSDDAKTALQHLVEQDGSAVLEYDVVSESGPEHNKLFTVEVRVNNNLVGSGTASTKKEAEMIAARTALKLFGINL